MLEDHLQTTMQDANSFAQNMRLPKPPKPGEIMICQMCGQPMLPEHFSKNIVKRKREFKWHVHDACFSAMDNLCDRSVPGLLQERKPK